MAGRHDHARRWARDALQRVRGTSAKNHRTYQTRGPRPDPERALAPSRSTVRPMATGASSFRCSSRRSSCSSRGKPRLYGGGKKDAAATATITQCRRSRCKSSPLTRGRRKSDPEHRWHDPGLNRWRRGHAVKFRDDEADSGGGGGGLCLCVCLFLFYVFFTPLMMMDEAAPLDNGCRWCVTWSESFNELILRRSAPIGPVPRHQERVKPTRTYGPRNTLSLRENTYQHSFSF